MVRANLLFRNPRGLLAATLMAVVMTIMAASAVRAENGETRDKIAADPAMSAAEATSGATTERKVVNVATLHWPPFTADSLPETGAASAVLQAAFNEMGFDVHIRFWPWNRAIAKAKAGDDDMIGYFPGYHCHHDRSSDFLMSDSMGQTPLGLARLAESTHSWSVPEDLKSFRIGTVVGYATTEELDAWMREDALHAITSSNDTTNLLKLMSREIDFAIIDKYVLEYIKFADMTIHDNKHKIHFDDNILEMKDLYLCFRNSERALRKRDIFNEGLSRIDSQNILDGYIDELISDLSEQVEFETMQ